MAEPENDRLHLKADPEEPPPIFGTWRRFYTVVVVNTIAVYILLLVFSYLAGR